MAYNPLTSSEVINGAVLDQTTLVKVKDNFNDHEAQLQALKVQEAWITPTLLNGWYPYQTPQVTHPTAQYYKDDMGTVRLKGLVRSPTATSSDIFNLPVGYRPQHAMIIPVSSGDVFAQIVIYASGNVTYDSGGAPASWLSLANVAFRAEV